MSAKGKKEENLTKKNPQKTKLPTEDLSAVDWWRNIFAHGESQLSESLYGTVSDLRAQVPYELNIPKISKDTNKHKVISLFKSRFDKIKPAKEDAPQTIGNNITNQLKEENYYSGTTVIWTPVFEYLIHILQQKYNIYIFNGKHLCVEYVIEDEDEKEHLIEQESPIHVAEEDKGIVIEASEEVKEHLIDPSEENEKNLDDPDINIRYKSYLVTYLFNPLKKIDVYYEINKLQKWFIYSLLTVGIVFVTASIFSKIVADSILILFSLVIVYFFYKKGEIGKEYEKETNKENIKMLFPKGQTVNGNYLKKETTRLFLDIMPNIDNTTNSSYELYTADTFFRLYNKGVHFSYIQLGEHISVFTREERKTVFLNEKESDAYPLVFIKEGDMVFIINNENLEKSPIMRLLREISVHELNIPEIIFHGCTH